MARPLRCLVVGGGISGLAAAHRLAELSRERDRPMQITLLEAQDRLGGLIDTQRRDGWLFEGGPDAFVSEKPWAIQLCKRLGIAEELIGTRPGGRSFIVCRGRLTEVPAGWYLLAPVGVSALLRAPFLSWRGKLRIACEPCVPPRRAQGDESVGSFIRRRFGREALARVGEPMIGGIYAADPERLSLQATLPQFVELEREFGSVTAGLRAGSRRPEDALREASGPRYSLFVSFRDGVQRLVQALVASMPEVAVRTGSSVVGIERAEGWRVRLTGGDRIDADALCLALPAPQAAAVVRGAAPALAEELAGIPYASVATINLAFRQHDVPRAIAGFGFVVPAIERRRIIGCTFSSSKFPGRAPEGMALIRAFLGGGAGPGICDMPETTIEQAVRDELRALLGLRAAPCAVSVRRYRQALPQYEVGHLSRVERIEAHAARYPGLFLSGNGYHGLGIPDCVRQAERAALRLADFRQHTATGTGAHVQSETTTGGCP